MRRVLPLSIALSLTVYVIGAGQWFPGPDLVEILSRRSEAAHERFKQARLNDSNPLTEYLHREEEFAEELSEAQLLRRMGQVYEYQADVLNAQAKGDEDGAKKYLEKAARELAGLMRHQGVVANPQFQELYRSVLAEYERHVGAPPDTFLIPRGEIYGFRDSLFAALNAHDAPLLEDLSLAQLRPLPGTVPLTMNGLVQKTVGHLQNRNLDTWLSRAETYFPMIEQVLREEKAPDELKYLAVVESGLNPRAQSWVGASGLWQFMSGTGREYDLDANAWVDERNDPEKATRAAARYLLHLQKLMGDWHLALAAYNCGPGNVYKAVRRLKSASPGTRPTFWTIYPYLPQETRNYVPMYIATALVLSNADGPDEKGKAPVYEYDLVPVPGNTALADVAELAGTTEAALKALNPELRRSNTPPVKGHYKLRIPLGAYEQLAANVNQQAHEKDAKPSNYVVARGETLGEVARKFGLTTALLMDVNGLRNSRVRSGQKLRLPNGNASEHAPRLTLAGAEPVRIRYGAREDRPLTAIKPPREVVRGASAKVEQPGVAVAAKPVAKKEPEKKAVTYTVRRGDTLSSIARRNGITVAQLKSQNGLRSNTIRAGQRLTVRK